MKKSILFGAFALAGAAMLTSCDWTDPEPVDLNYDNISEADPDLYARYLKNLREYRDNGHKKVYAWFDNKSSFVSQADHVSAVPDSIDVLVMTRPEAMSQATLNEINAKRSDTGMQTAYVVDYAAIRKAWELKKELETPASPVAEWSVFMADSLQKALAHFDGGGFDRLVCAYDGHDMSVYGDEAKAAEQAEQKAFLEPFKAWKSSHFDKGLDFMGIPANLFDASILADAGVVFLSESVNATNTTEYDYYIRRNSVNGAPTAKFAIVAQLPVLDEGKASVGYWGKDYSSWLAARWARNGAVCALGLFNLSDDYYNPQFVFPVCRGAIQTLNPAAK